MTSKRRAGATLGAIALGLSAALVLPSAASAAPVVSQAEGRLLQTSLLGTNLTDALAVLNGAKSVNTDASGDVTTNLPLNAQAVAYLIGLQSGGINIFGDNGIIQLGALAQWSQAKNDGSSSAYSGAVSGASSLLGLGTNEVQAGASVGSLTDQNARLKLGTANILGGVDLVNLSVNVGVLGAAAKQGTSGAPEGDYVLADLNVKVGGTIIQGVLGPVRTALGTLLAAAQLVGLDIPNPIAADGSVQLSATDITEALGVGDLNDLAPNTNLLAALPVALVNKVTGMVNTVLDQVQAKVTALGPIVGGALNLALGTARGILNPILNGLTNTLAGPIGTAINAIAGIVVNKQATAADGAFTETALAVRIGGAAAPLAEVDLANATVGPNAGEAAVPISGGEGLALAGVGIGAVVLVGALRVKKRRTREAQA